MENNRKLRLKSKYLDNLHYIAFSRAMSLHTASTTIYISLGLNLRKTHNELLTKHIIVIFFVL